MSNSEKTHNTLTMTVQVDGHQHVISNTTLRRFCKLIIDDIESDGEIRGLFYALHSEYYWKLAIEKRKA